MLAAFDLEKTYSKQQIFEMYANTIYDSNWMEHVKQFQQIGCARIEPVSYTHRCV